MGKVLIYNVGYGAADRWGFYNNSVTGRTISRQASGLDGFTYCLRLQRDSGITTTQNTQAAQIIESSIATSLQGKYVTVSFWARAGANYSVASSNITVVLYAGTGTDQNPYTSGYTGQTTPISTNQAITTSWVRYSFTTSAALASTITELTLAIQSGTFVGTAGANDYFEITGVQLEPGSIATAFARAGGTIQGELAACQRYYYRQSANGTNFIMDFGIGSAASTTSFEGSVILPVQMRIPPTSLDSASLQATDLNTNYAITSPTIGTARTGVNVAHVTGTISGATQYRLYYLGSASSSGYIGLSAEL